MYKSIPLRTKQSISDFDDFFYRKQGKMCYPPFEDNNY